ncbi:hypothetical protein JYK14_01205 [Siccirubricoccus sp. KC 17139]|uniref:ATP-binding protein n=1 Tax=Siccirubricoccus soli TaxID=2899147 RepID=A0ABT1CYQ3_9PROT|nr:hypothetical protein [Siccirubricoccus soli]MCO6414798.1 hypothetical protein [Siccirubricoccus soli]MCP2680928.1 hypothetical protein [Siccirubricoccus soli]
MAQPYKLREVFSRGMPTVTYVERSHLDLERKLRGAVAKGYAIIAITGPSKCGKTVLRKRVIPDNATVKVEGGQIVTEGDFWATISAQLEMPSTRTESAIKQATGSSNLGGSIGPRFAKVTGGVGETQASTRGSTRTFVESERSRVLAELLASGKVLVIDDFHYLKESTRASIVRALKAPVFEGLPVVILSVPYRAFDVLTAEAEMEGRFNHLTIPMWNSEDLCKIGALGFPYLGLDLSSEPPETGGFALIEALADEAMGSPLLMQSLCAELCDQLDILETVDPPRQISHEDVDLKIIYRRIAQDFGLPAFEKLSKGPKRGSDRMPRPFANFTTGDIYEAVLAAIAHENAPERLTYDALRGALRHVLMDNIPQKHEITRAIMQMCSIAHGMQVGSIEQREGAGVEDTRLEMPAIDWKDDVLYLNDVFLRFYLKWVHRDKIEPPTYGIYTGPFPPSEV